MNEKCDFCGGDMLGMWASNGEGWEVQWETCEEQCTASQQAQKVLRLGRELASARAALVRKDQSLSVVMEENKELRAALVMSNDTARHLLSRFEEQRQPSTLTPFFSHMEIAVYMFLPFSAGLVDAIFTKSGLSFVLGCLVGLLTLSGLVWVNDSRRLTS